MGKGKIITIRLNENEYRKMEQMIKESGMNQSDLIKTVLFKNTTIVSENARLDKRNIYIHLQKINDEVNAIEKRYPNLKTDELRKGVYEIWKLLSN